MGNYFRHMTDAFQDCESEANNVGSTLDRIISQCSQYTNDCPLYHFVNYQRGGILIDTYSKEGMPGIERILRDSKAQSCLYRPGGKITQRERNKWRRMHNKELSVTIEYSYENMSKRTDPVNIFIEHEACWKLTCRGILGESLLHCMLLCNTKVHNKLAQLCLLITPSLAIDVIEGEEYFGVSAVHLCIVYNQIDLLKALVENGADVHQRATGTFFRPSDQQKRRPKKSTNYEGLCYMGEYPLAWAASCGNETAYNYLIDKNADPNLQDSYGNTVLHMLIIHNMQEMYGYALRHPTKPANNSILNHSGLTPLTLACRLGRNDIFRYMLEVSALEFWRYSNITCAGYPLNALDSILPNGKINWNSALMIILSGKKEQHHDMLNGGVIQKLLEEKWRTFARTQFIKRLGLLCLHLLILTFAIWLRPSYNESLIGGSDWKSILRYCSEIFACIGCIVYVFYQQGSELAAQGPIGYFFNLTCSPPKFIFLISNLLLLACIPTRIFRNRKMEDVLLAFVLPSSWFFLIFFAGAVRLTGPFVTMIYQMLTGDMLRFGIILLIFLLGFTQAFYFLFKNTTQTMFQTYYDTWMALLHMMLGEYEYPDLDTTYYNVLTKIVFVVFMILIPILLLNMLIAMMGNTYIQIITRSEKEWMKQWASIVLNLERSLNKNMARKFMRAYSMKLNTNDDEDEDKEQRVVMVIKSRSKSKARQRKGALFNWRKTGKKIIEEIKKRGGTAKLYYEYEKKLEETGDRKTYRSSAFVSENNSDYIRGSSAVDKFGDTLDKIAWATDMNLQLQNTIGGPSLSDIDSNKSTKHRFLASDNVHPGQEVRSRSFSDNRQVVKLDSSFEASSKINGGKRKKKKNFLKNNKVGVVKVMAQGCIEDVTSSLDSKRRSSLPLKTISGYVDEKYKNESLPSENECTTSYTSESRYSKSKSNSPELYSSKENRFKNWSSKEVKPITELCQWDNRTAP